MAEAPGGELPPSVSVPPTTAAEVVAAEDKLERSSWSSSSTTSLGIPSSSTSTPRMQQPSPSSQFTSPPSPKGKLVAQPLYGRQQTEENTYPPPPPPHYHDDDKTPVEAPTPTSPLGPEESLDDMDAETYARHVAHNDPEREYMLAGDHLNETQFPRGGLSVSELLNPSSYDDQNPAVIDGDGEHDSYCLGDASALNQAWPSQVDSDADSAMGDIDGAPSTSSLRSSIYQYVEEYGRTFHKYKQGKYWMPNDRIEQERLDLQHAVFMKLLDGRFGLAPVTNPQAVLDVGTGTGIWAIEFATEHPSAHVIGTDLSPIQPEYVPANCHFEVDDADDDWIFSHPFDYIHLRMIFHSFRSHKEVMRSGFENLLPGGWIEYQDYYCHLQSVDGTLQGTALERWSQLYVEGGLRLGRDMLAPRKYKQWMEETGYVNVTEQKLVIPGNPWPKGHDLKLLGAWQMANFLEGIHAVTMTIFTRGLGMSSEEVELLLVDVRKDIKNLGVHFYFLTYFVYGQKPLIEGSGHQ